MLPLTLCHPPNRSNTHTSPSALTGTKRRRKVMRSSYNDAGEEVIGAQQRIMQLVCACEFACPALHLQHSHFLSTLQHPTPHATQPAETVEVTDDEASPSPPPKNAQQQQQPKPVAAKPAAASGAMRRFLGFLVGLLVCDCIRCCWSGFWPATHFPPCITAIIPAPAGGSKKGGKAAPAPGQKNIMSFFTKK